MTRHGGSGSLLDALNLSYSGNRLAAVSHSGGTWSYGHDGSGRMTSDGRLGGIAVQYGETGLPRRTMGPPGSGIATTEYSYLADGTRLGVTQNIGTSSSTIYGYLSFGGVGMIQLGSNLSFESSVFDGGVIQSGGVRYFTRDHLGNTRVVTDGSGNVVERNDYYPFGERHSDSSMPKVNSNRWRFAGKEIQPLGGTGWLDFGARQYDSFLGRWTTVDPLAEKYPGISPYSYCAGNPINFVDPDGKFPGFLWDIANVVMDVKSLVSNIKDHNTGAAIADGVGLVADAVAAAIPILPAGAGATLKAVRGADKIEDVAKIVDKTSDVAKSSQGKKTYQTYIKINEKTGEVYVGRTSGYGSPLENVRKRDKNHHMNNKGYGDAILVNSTDNYDAIRGQEQYLIDLYGGAKSSGGTSGNAINGVSKSNKNAAIYENARKKEFNN